ncbi:hypothetical protein IGI04_007057 [Brassica rapa subsp. trilocularis]|uniref:Uncharacterized protein n=1 Tax=Brassica rapa subsp. trilocularis TaxID=1813537 RepID=A0ABQ7NIM7_BRACM|nr:hypothetical protein IGI04_007057 [Brassica rapa subsp. trilocularis]
MKLVTKLGLETSSASKCRVSDVSTSIDGTCVHRLILIFICQGISWYRSIALMQIYVVSSGEMSFKLQNAPKISDQDWTGFHESKLNGGCHQSSLRKRALKIAASKSRFELFYWSLYESSINGVTFQTCLKNPIPCIPSPKISGYVRFSVRNQLWLLHTVQGKCVVDRLICFSIFSAICNQ